MSNWKIKLDIQAKDANSTKSLCDALATDCEVVWNDESFSVEIIEGKAKDLRAMWNTRIRGLIAVNSLMTVIDQY